MVFLVQAGLLATLQATIIYAVYGGFHLIGITLGKRIHPLEIILVETLMREALTLDIGMEQLGVRIWSFVVPVT
jgi:hypothetical protein